jgi:hypothetical protein
MLHQMLSPFDILRGTHQGHSEVHSYSAKTLHAHVQGIANAASDFYNALGVEDAELDTFANAALSLNRKSRTSPGSPVESK